MLTQWEPRRLTEAADHVLLVDLDDAERRLERRDRDRGRRRAFAVPREQRAEVDVEQLVAVEGVAGAALVPARRREAEAPPRPSGSSSPASASSMSTPPSACANARSCPAWQLMIARVTPAAASSRNWCSASGRPAISTSAFGLPPGSVTEPLGLAAGEDDCFHEL